MKKIFVFLLCALAASSCAHDIIDLTGDIQGVVKDYKDGQLISNCQVSLMPTGKTTTTDLVGKFIFDGIEPGEYILEFSKAGYMEELIKVKVVTGKVTEANIMLKAKSPFSLSETNMDFGEMETNKAVLIQNETDSDCTYSVKNVPSWLSLNPSSGTVPANGNTTVIFTVNREKADVGEYSQEISFDYTGKYTGSAVLSVRMQKTIAPIGRVYGVVKEELSGDLISNCEVSITPGGIVRTTDQAGRYEFADLNVGSYSIAFRKAGFKDASIQVTVVAGGEHQVDVRMTAKSPFFLAETSLDFGEMEINKVIHLYNQSDADCTYSVKNVPSWLSLNPSSGTVPANGNTTVIFTVNREKADVGEYSQEISFDYTGKYTGSAVLSVRMQKTIAPIGRVYGVVKEELSGDLISNCEVSITPGGIVRTTDQAGRYEFADLNVGSYSIAFRKAGFKDASIQVTVVAGGEHQVDVRMTAKSPFFLAETSLDFGEMEINKVIHLYNESDADCTYSVKNVPSWLLLDPATGTVAAGSSATVAASVNKDAVNCGKYFQEISFDYTGKRPGSVSIPVSMEKVELSTPTVSCGALAENIEETSFDISGSVVSIGGQAVTSYGHCWSLSPEPTVSDNMTNMGRVVAPTDFKSTINGLSAGTTYYVRAYAENAMGVSYSEEVSVTTQDIKSDKWDGSKASSFSAGTGAKWDPYIIETGGQLLLAKDHSDKYFELGGNIDLNNKNWLPFEFKGTLDGKGYSISNLYINRIDDSQGLFSTCSGTVSNLTVRNVNINAPQSSHVGTLSGTGGTFNNCKVILGEASSITGNNYVGGIAGLEAKLTGCSVESMSQNPVVRGNSNVGGLVGQTSLDIESCVVNASVVGAEQVGGIVGYGGKRSYGGGSHSINSSSFQGRVEGESHVGGIIGQSIGGFLNGCKVDAEVVARESCAGGLIGYNCDYNVKVVGCYTHGSVNAKTDCGGLVGDIYGYSEKCYLCFSAMESAAGSFKGLGDGVYTDCATVHSYHGSYPGTNVRTSCTDITTFLQECYSDYASYWNYNNTWTWKGTINGKEVSVSCPRLAWEQ